jgi:hypothetical protein
MYGRVLSGSYQGASLDALDQQALMKLLGEVDNDSRDLLAAYLDRREPGWREHAQHHAGSGTRPTSGGNVTKEEAYQILGLQRGASTEEISRAHRSLIKKLHPDQGGTTYLAARINEAKDASPPSLSWCITGTTNVSTPAKSHTRPCESQRYPIAIRTRCQKPGRAVIQSDRSLFMRSGTGLI